MFKVSMVHLSLLWFYINFNWFFWLAEKKFPSHPNKRDGFFFILA